MAGRSSDRSRPTTIPPQVMIGEGAASGGPLSPAGPLPRVAAIILAAGESRRMGTPKQLLPFGRLTMLEQVVEILLESSVQRVFVVLGHRAAEIAVLPSLQLPGVEVIVNVGYPGGMFTSVRAGIAAAGANWDAYCLALGDQPLVGPGVIGELVAGFAATRPAIAIPTWEGRRGHPLLLRGDLFRTIVDAPESWTLREVRERYRADTTFVPVSSAGILDDADTPDDYQRLTRVPFPGVS